MQKNAKFQDFEWKGTVVEKATKERLQIDYIYFYLNYISGCDTEILFNPDHGNCWLFPGRD